MGYWRGARGKLSPELQGLREHVFDVARALDRLDPGSLDAVLKIIRNPIRGGAVNLMAGLTSQTGTVALSTSTVFLFGTAGAPLVLNTPQYAPSPVPWGIAFAYIQETVGISAAATMTVAINGVQNGVSTQIGAAISINQAASAAPVDTTMAMGLVSGPTTEITCTATLSAGTGTVQNSATAPSILGVLSMI